MGIRPPEDRLAHPGSIVFVAHGLGCFVVSEWANDRSDPSVAGAFLVAVPDPDGPNFPSAATGFDDPTIATLAFPSLVVAGADDPYGSIDHARALAEAWGAGFVDAGAGDDLNAESGLGAWDEGWDLLQRFIDALKA